MGACLLKQGSLGLLALPGSMLLLLVLSARPAVPERLCARRGVHMHLVLLLYFAARYEDALACLKRHKPAILAVHGFCVSFFDFCERLEFICEQERLSSRNDALEDAI